MKNSFMTKSKYIAGLTFLGAGLAHSALLITSTTPVVVGDSFFGVNFNINPGTDAIDDFNITVIDSGGDQASLTAFGLGTATIAVQPTITSDALFVEAGDTVGPTNTFDGNAAGFTGSFLASEDGGGGEWAGGTTGFLGFDFDIAGDTHYGFARVTWTPDVVGSTSVATIDLIGYETDAGVPVAVPEPSTSFLLSALAGIALIRRRRS